jgi:hypothetical protein
MNLGIGLAGGNKGWETILQQEGFAWLLLDQSNAPELAGDKSCLIIHNKSEVSGEEITDYITQGGTVLFEAVKFSELFKRKIKSTKVRSVFPQENGSFKSLGLLDIYEQTYIVNGNSFNLLDRNLNIFSGIIGKGNFYIIPFDLERLYSDHRCRRKRFPAERKELPSEIVSTVSKGQLRRLVKILIEEIYRQKDLPLIQKWYWSTASESCFAFRVDTDYCAAEDATNLFKICRENELSATWFIDTEDDNRIRQVYANLEEQETAFHCDRHRVFKNIGKNRYYLDKGLDKLAAVDLSVSGYAAPFGEWNEALAAVLEEKGFSYSSEFSLNYDDLPYYPFTARQSYSVLQIPIHPISLGRLRRSHFTEKEMVKYFQELIDHKIEEQEPVVIYHHPAHRHFAVINEIFQYVRSKKIPTMNFEQWAMWWKFREQINLQGELRKNKLALSCGEEVDFHIKITYQDKYCIIPYQPQVDLQKLDWKTFPEKKQRTIDKNIRKWHWRDLLYNYESFKGKLRR